MLPHEPVAAGATCRLSGLPPWEICHLHSQVVLSVKLTGHAGDLLCQNFDPEQAELKVVQLAAELVEIPAGAGS